MLRRINMLCVCVWWFVLFLLCLKVNIAVRWKTKKKTTHVEVHGKASASCRNFRLPKWVEINARHLKVKPWGFREDESIPLFFCEKKINSRWLNSNQSFTPNLLYFFAICYRNWLWWKRLKQFCKSIVRIKCDAVISYIYKLKWKNLIFWLNATIHILWTPPKTWNINGNK